MYATRLSLFPHFFVNLVKVPEKDTDAFATVITLNCKKSHKMQYNVRRIKV